MNRKQRRAAQERRRDHAEKQADRRRVDELAAGVDAGLEPGQLRANMRFLGYEYVEGGWRRRPKPRPETPQADEVDLIWTRGRR